MLAELLPEAPTRMLDLGCGDGVLGRLALSHRPSLKEVLCLDNSDAMLSRARATFADDARVTVAKHDLNQSLGGASGAFDVITSGCAIHHLADARKQALFEEIARLLNDDGVFLNLDVVASPNDRLHQDFLVAIGRTADDPEDRLAPVASQEIWLREAGFNLAACMWQWRGFALFAAWKHP
jgi:tRNA (cmo5U34)-methyltransferase